MAMRMSNGARKELTEASEGCRLKAYRDCVGQLTIFFGHTSMAGPPHVTVGMVGTKAQADMVLADDLAVFEKGVAAELKNCIVLQREFDAMVDLAFNIGLGNFRSSSLLRHYRAGDKATAARDFLSWNRAGGKVVAGLSKRREAERQWFMYGHLAHSVVTVANLDDVKPEDMPRLVDHPDGVMMRAANRLIGLAA